MSHVKNGSESEEKIPSALDWYPRAAEDKGNPKNCSQGKKVYHSAIAASIAFLCLFGSSVYTPGIAQVSKEFGVSREVALLPFVFYLLGLAFGPVIAAPISETFGRRLAYISGLPVFTAFTLGAGFSYTITSLTVCRFFAGLASSPGLGLASGTIADIWEPHPRAVAMAIFVCAVQMGPACEPLVGGYTTDLLNWRWSQWTILFGLALVIAIAVPMSETYKAAILGARAERLGIEGPLARADWNANAQILLPL